MARSEREIVIKEGDDIEKALGKFAPTRSAKRHTPSKAKEVEHQ
jgi:hypothetical protein